MIFHEYGQDRSGPLLFELPGDTQAPFVADELKSRNELARDMTLLGLVLAFQCIFFNLINLIKDFL